VPWCQRGCCSSLPGERAAAGPGAASGELRCKAGVLPTDYLKPIAEEERRIEAEEKKKREELERIAKELAEGSPSV